MHIEALGINNKRLAKLYLDSLIIFDTQDTLSNKLLKLKQHAKNHIEAVFMGFVFGYNYALHFSLFGGETMTATELQKALHLCSLAKVDENAALKLIETQLNELKQLQERQKGYYEVRDVL